MAQKSCPSGAPTRAATASMAVTPGTMVTSSARHSARPGLDRLADRRRHGEDAGIAARDDRDPLALCGLRQRRLRARDLLAVVGRDLDLVRPELQPVEIGPVAEEPFAPRRRPRSLPASSGAASPGPRPMTATWPLCSAHGLSCPARHQHDRKIGRLVVRLVGEPHRDACSPWCRARHRSPGRAGRSRPAPA